MKMYRGLAIILVLLFISTGMVMAGGDKEESFFEEPTKMLVYWHPSHMYDTYKTVFAEFEKEKNVKIELVDMVWDAYKTKINADFEAGTPPDLAEVHHTWTIEFGNRGEFMDLTDYLAKWDGYDEWYESAWTDVSSVEGTPYGVKMHHTCFAFFWNKDVFRKAGLDPDTPPATLEEMLEYAEIITKKLGPDVLGFAMDPTGQFSMPFLVDSETPYLVADGKVTVGSSTSRKTFGLLQELIQSGNAYIPDPSGSAGRVNVRALFLAGKFGMEITGPWELSNIKANFPDFDYGVAMVPHVKGVEPLTLSTGTAMGIPTGAKEPDLAWELLTRIIDLDVQVETTIQTGMLMPRSTWADDSRIQDLKEMKFFKPILPHSVPYDIAASQYTVPEITYFGPVWDKLYQSLLYSDKDINIAIDEYVKDANALLAESK